jgi:sugar transferase EpsL
MFDIYRNHVKRALDLLASGLLLVVLSPVFAVTAAVVWLFLGRPVLFVQQRPGLHGKPFRICKFRTMLDKRDAEGRLLPDTERMSVAGSVIRRLSLDELPQLWNVLRGEMSFVGPRPLLMQYMPRYTPEQARRHEVRPGISGWAQVNGRNALGWEEKFQLDVWYVDHLSFPLDCKIAWLTVWNVLRRRGISAQGHATMPEFMGTPAAPAPREHSIDPPAACCGVSTLRENRATH